MSMFITSGQKQSASGRKSASGPKIALVDGVRTPFCKASGQFTNVSADELGTRVVQGLLARTAVDLRDIDELICGNVGQPADAANIARVIARQAGLPTAMPAVTVHRNCASGMEALTTAATKIAAGRAHAIIVVGTESMSSLPLFFNKAATKWFGKLARSRSTWSRVKTLATWRPHMMRPDIGVLIGLHDKVAGLGMGETAEILANEFNISRQEQDAYALESHEKACRAQKDGFYDDEITSIPVAPTFGHTVRQDDGPRQEQSMQALGKLRPVFNRKTGSVTAGNACPLTDGAVAMLVCDADWAKAHGLSSMGYLRDFAYVGCDDRRMGLGPVYATHKLLQQNSHWSLSSFDRIELNEAFAAQAIACYKAFESKTFANDSLHTGKAVGTIDPDRCNVNGGAIALGHPVGSTGLRLILTLLRELQHNGLKRGLATLCIGGGQGAAVGLEAA